MKRLFQFLGIAILLLVIVFISSAIIQPKDLVVERSIVIKAPQQAVFNQIQFFKNWPNWSPWIAKEPTMKLTYVGIDGQKGSSYSWIGDEMGEGEMKNTNVTYKQLDYNLHFIKPWEGLAEGYLSAQDQSNGTTKVSWHMVNHGSFPMNALNYFVEKIIGNDFEEGLELLKNYAEAHPQVALSKLNVEEKEYPATLLASIRKKIPFTEMQHFSIEAFSSLSKAAAERISGPASTVYYVWDEKTQTTDMAPAFAVSGTEPIKGVDMVNIPRSISCTILYKGGYGNLSKAHEVLNQYILEKGRRLNLILEEYIVGPATESDSTKWVTNVVYLVK